MAEGVAEIAAGWRAAISGVAERRSQALHTARWVLGGFLLGTVVCLAWVASEALAFAITYSGRILPGAVIAGVDVSGMTREEALAAVQAVVDPQLDRTVRLIHFGSSWETTARQLGARSDAEGVVADAVAASAATDWIDWFRLRWQGQDLGFAQSVALVHDDQAVRAFVGQIATEVDIPVRDAAIDYSSGWIELIPEQVGRAVAVDATTADLLRAFSGGRQEVPVHSIEVQPAVRMEEFDQVLLLRQREHRLYLYQNGVRTHDWLVSTGTGGYPTPRGEFEVEAKRYMPTWINPDPKGWGADMPAQIDAGPTNPLGLRALNWSGGSGIRFHGTSNIGSLGRSASHGCVRLSNRDVVQLYDLVDAGATIISLR